MTFDQAFERTLGHEGGLVDNPADPGGLTQWGISQRAYPNEDIRALTADRAKALYLRDYWGPAGCDAVPDAVKADLFDMAVNAGVKTAIRALQRAVGETQDGVIGPRTLQALGSMPADRLRLRFNAARLKAYTDAKAWPTFGRGWVLRVVSNMEA